MDQRIINLYDNFTHGGMSRRDFFDRLTKLAGSTAAATALLPLLQNDYAQAAVVAENDARLVTERVSYDSPKGKINGYLARPKSKGKRPVVLVIHENRGLNPHLEDVARRFAVEGFLGYAVDLLSLVGGTPPNEDAARELHPKMNQDDAVAALVAAVSFLQEASGIRPARSAPSASASAALMVNRLAAIEPRARRRRSLLRTRRSPADQVPNIKARAAAALRREGRRRERRHRRLRGGAQGQQQEVHAVQLSGHAARLLQRPRRRALQQGSGRPAWSRTLAFFKEQLGAPPNAA